MSLTCIADVPPGAESGSGMWLPTYVTNGHPCYWVHMVEGLAPTPYLGTLQKWVDIDFGGVK